MSAALTPAQKAAELKKLESSAPGYSPKKLEQTRTDIVKAAENPLGAAKAAVSAVTSSVTSGLSSALLLVVFVAGALGLIVLGVSRMFPNLTKAAAGVAAVTA